MGTSATPIEVGTTPRTKAPPRAFKKLKAWCWRGTASLLWADLIMHSVSPGAKLAGWLQLSTTAWIAGKLSDIGFAPSNSHHAILITFVGWLLVITGLNFVEVVGFFIYLTSFPIVLIWLIWFREIRLDVQNADTGSEKETVGRAIRVSLLAFLVWYLLYANAAARGPLILGSLIAGSLFLCLTLRAFSRTGPPENYETKVLRNIAVAGLRSLENVAQNVVDKKIQTRNALIINYKLNYPVRLFYSRLAWYVRGRRGQNRAYFLVLTEYVVSLLLLGFSAVLFWALVQKSIAAPVVPSFGAWLRYCSTFFLIGVPAPSGMPTLPAWSQIGPAVTAWILFVLYVGPAAAQIPFRQQALAKSFASNYLLLRKVAGGYGKFYHLFRKAAR